MRRTLLILLLLVLTGGAPSGKGPLWWRVSDGHAVLWIMGVPNGMLNSVKWDETSLNRRFDQADRLYYPNLAGRIVAPTVAGASGGFGYFRPTPVAILTDPDQTLKSYYASTLGNQFTGEWGGGNKANAAPKSLWTRFDKIAGKLNWQAPGVFHQMPTWRAAAWLDRAGWPKGSLGNPVAWRLFEMDHGKVKPITEIEVDSEIVPAQGVGRDTTPPEALQDQCLSQVMDQYEGGALLKARLAGMEAWARGDLDHALKRDSSLPLCLMGAAKSTDAQAYFERQAFIEYSALDEAFRLGGQSVTVVAFDPLLADHGVLDHYRRLGYEISLSDGMD